MTALPRGVFTLSLDFELVWGTLDLFGPEGFGPACEIERGVVVPRLLDLFAEYEIPATWCVLGHLFLDQCKADGGRVHPELPRPTHAWRPGDWYAQDPAGTEATHPIFYGRSLVEQIRRCPVPQEIGCHSFSHAIFGDAGCSRAVADAEVATCARLARAMGVSLRSFAFPRNRVGHLDVLREHGFACYRGPGPRWYEQDDEAGPAGRLAHLWDVVRAAEPPTVLPEATASGLVNIPGSMIYFPMHGVRRFVPMARRVARAVKGLEAAARRRRVFHLWFHPTNLADRTDAMMDGLRQVFAHAAALRGRGELDVLPMAALAGVAEEAGARYRRGEPCPDPS
jgi:peptidoglycan/xylan/chitin deacetylase (PgdA/CDA1 family)